MNLFSFFKKKNSVKATDPNRMNQNIDSPSLAERVDMLKHLVEASDNGHLNLSYRVSLLSLISDVNTVNKIFLQCAIKVFPIWEKEFPNHSFINSIHSFYSYLYDGVGDKMSFLSLGDEFRDILIERVQNPQKRTAGLVGYTIQSLAYNIAFDAELILGIYDYQGEDDDVFDWEGWNPDYYASMAYSGGSPFHGTGDIDKRKEFWIWFLDTVFLLSENSEKLILPLPSSHT